MDLLPHENLLSTIAEVAATFVGFSLVVGVLRSDTGDSAERFLASRDVAEIGLIVVAAALLPMALHSHGWNSEATWRVSSLAFSTAWLVGLGIAARRRVRRGLRLQSRPALGGFLLTVGVAGNGLLLRHAVSPGPGAGASYLTSLLLFLGLAGILFIIATFAGADDAPPV